MSKLAAAMMILMVSTVWTTGAQAFDGQRRGFVLGGGLGFAPTIKWDSEIPDWNETKAGVAVQIVAGYGWDEHNVIAWEANGAGFQSDFGNANITQLFNGVAWYHYFGSVGKGLFTAVGVGLYQFEFEFSNSRFTASGSNDPGAGLLLGAGYEFTPHFQIGAYISAGKTSEPGIDYDHTHVNLLVTGLAF